MKRVLGAMIVLGLVGCGDPLVDPQTVVGLRLLGARVSATDEPTRAHVDGGEDAELKWLVLADKTRTFNGLGRWCEAEPSAFGTPPCHDPFHEVEFTADSDSPISLPFTLPNDLKDDKWVHWIGLCESGTPKWRENAQRFECSKGEVVSAVYRGNTSASNQNPDLQDDELSLNGKAWPAPQVDVEPACGADGVPNVTAEDTATIRLRAKGADREELDNDDYAAATQESITYTHVTTWPSLERPYSALEGEATQFEVTFTNESNPPKSGGELVRFALVGRDGRGGSDWLERWFCLKP
jgi:hypothetical protein